MINNALYKLLFLDAYQDQIRARNDFVDVLLDFREGKVIWIMRNCIAMLFIAALLSGCAAHYQESSDDYSRKKEIEEASWTTLKRLSSDRCGATPEPPVRQRAVQLSNCVTGLVYEYVLPHAIFPHLLIDSRTEALRIARDYAAGKMSPAEYKLRSEARLKAYSDSMPRFAGRQEPSGLG